MNNTYERMADLLLHEIRVVGPGGTQIPKVQSPTEKAHTQSRSHARAGARWRDPAAVAHVQQSRRGVKTRGTGEPTPRGVMQTWSADPDTGHEPGTMQSRVGAAQGGGFAKHVGAGTVRGHIVGGPPKPAYRRMLAAQRAQRRRAEGKPEFTGRPKVDIQRSPDIYKPEASRPKKTTSYFESKVYERMAELMYETLTPKEIAKQMVGVFAQNVTKHATGVEQTGPKKGSVAYPLQTGGGKAKGNPKLPKTKK